MSRLIRDGANQPIQINFRRPGRHSLQGKCKRPIKFTLLLLALLSLAACGGNNGALWGPGGTLGNATTNHITANGGLIIFAPPTLQFVLPPLTQAFFQARGLTVPYAFSFSNAGNNANVANTATNADVLILDDAVLMLNARNLGYVSSKGTLLAKDTLKVVLPPTNPGKIHTLQDLARPGLHYLGIAPESGLNAHIQAVLESMMLAPAFGKAYPARVYGNLYNNYTDGLRAAQALLANPPAGDFAIIYQNEYLAIQRQYGARALLSLPIPAPFNQSFPVLASLTSYAPHPDLAQPYIQFLHSPQAQKIWAQYGFQPAS